MLDRKNFEETLSRLLSGLSNPFPKEDAETRAARLARNEETKRKVKARAERIAREAIGLPLAVRVGKNETNRGIIKNVEPLEPDVIGDRVSVRFRVSYSSSTGLPFPPVLLSSLPGLVRKR